MRIRYSEHEDQDAASESILFPTNPAEIETPAARARRKFDLTGLPDSAGQVLDAIDSLSRRIDDLARELNCLGHFDDDDDAPRAA